jgi:hypothetical protein
MFGDLFVASSDSLVITIKLTAKYSKPQLYGIQASTILLQLGKNSKEFYKITSETKLQCAYVHLLFSSSCSCH